MKTIINVVFVVALLSLTLVSCRNNTQPSYKTSSYDLETTKEISHSVPHDYVGRWYMKDFKVEPKNGFKVEDLINLNLDFEKNPITIFENGTAKYDSSLDGRDMSLQVKEEESKLKVVYKNTEEKVFYYTYNYEWRGQQLYIHRDGLFLKEEYILER